MAVEFYNIELNANCLEVPEFRTNAIFDYDYLQKYPETRQKDYRN